MIDDEIRDKTRWLQLPNCISHTTRNAVFLRFQRPSTSCVQLTTERETFTSWNVFFSLQLYYFLALRRQNRNWLRLELHVCPYELCLVIDMRSFTCMMMMWEMKNLSHTFLSCSLARASDEIERSECGVKNRVSASSSGRRGLQASPKN